ncbi:hypothetical protein QFC19_001496 [Naganishia cerealis]|uniref:Uncharacterized protein n=1 Tax=Naganishia cerealis TaxID=610337 RepID=A0ACC2WHY0_9TREE|nr:hypothetical protein QFC19_001496 [Naganishia cerealis]
MQLLIVLVRSTVQKNGIWMKTVCPPSLRTLYPSHVSRSLCNTPTELTFILLARPMSSGEASSTATTPSSTELKSYKMIGDVNLFLPQGVKEDVECEIMIAADCFPFLVRIGTSNHASIKLFESLGFAKVKVVHAFEEVEMRFGWVPEGDGSNGEGTFVDIAQMRQLAAGKWTKSGDTVWYE